MDMTIYKKILDKLDKGHYAYIGVTSNRQYSPGMTMKSLIIELFFEIPRLLKRDGGYLYFSAFCGFVVLT